MHAAVAFSEMLFHIYSSGLSNEGAKIKREIILNWPFILSSYHNHKNIVDEV